MLATGSSAHLALTHETPARSGGSARREVSFLLSLRYHPRLTDTSAGSANEGAHRARCMGA